MCQTFCTLGSLGLWHGGVPIYQSTDFFFKKKNGPIVWNLVGFHPFVQVRLRLFDEFVAPKWSRFSTSILPGNDRAPLKANLLLTTGLLLSIQLFPNRETTYFSTTTGPVLLLMWFRTLWDGCIQQCLQIGILVVISSRRSSAINFFHRTGNNDDWFPRPITAATVAGLFSLSGPIAHLVICQVAHVVEHFWR